MASDRVRRRLPADRESVTKRLAIRGYKSIFLTVGLYDDGTVGEVFLSGRQGEPTLAMADGACRAASVALQYGAPLVDLIAQWKGLRFEPAGFTDEADDRLRSVTSILDYVARVLEIRFGQ
jgi:ribonucleoside-diphosphate reductase alpha chain